MVTVGMIYTLQFFYFLLPQKAVGYHAQSLAVTNRVTEQLFG